MSLVITKMEGGDFAFVLTLWDHKILATALYQGHPSCLSEETEVQGGGKPSAVLRSNSQAPQVSCL